MTLADGPRFRRSVPDDLPAAYRVFRRSLFDYLHRIGMVDAATAADPPIESGWASQQGWMRHLSATAAEDWVAQDADGSIVGWAQSVERDGLLELTLFFVDPAAQTRGIGRGLLERAFPIGRGSARTIVATQDARALRLYLGAGVRYLTTSIDFTGRPSRVTVTTDLEIERADAKAPADVEAVLGIEEAVLGHRREVDLHFLLAERPAWIARRAGRVVGVAFGAAVLNTGPIAALDPADLPALMATVEDDAAARGLEEYGFTIPLHNHVATAHALKRRLAIDPFYTLILASDDRMQLDRWVHTQPAFIV